MFKFLSDKEQLLRERRKSEHIEARQKSVEVATSVAFVTLAENGSIDEVTATEHTELFSPWVSGVAYGVGALRQYNDELYSCVQAHTSQDNWTPDVAVSLWRKAGVKIEEYEVGRWYYNGNKVIFNGKICTCIAPEGVVCTWSPDEYPAYWE